LPSYFFKVVAALIVFVTPCHARLEVRSQPLYPDYLASMQVNTLDPRKPIFFGEQVVIFYTFPSCIEGQAVQLTLRYKNREIECYTHTPTAQSGHWTYRLVDEEYWKRGGILSYKVDLLVNNEIIEEWRHHLWVEIICK
jgi:hypothetical protein